MISGYMTSPLKLHTLVVFLGDFLVLAGSLPLTLAVRYRELPSEEVLFNHLVPFSVLFVVWLAVFFIAGLYDTHISLERKRIPGAVLKVQVINILLAAVFFFVLPLDIAPKTNLVLYLIISTVLISSWRLFLFPYIRFGKRSRAIIVGVGSEAHTLAKILNENPHFRFLCVDTFDITQYNSSHELEEKLSAYLTEHPEVAYVIGDINSPNAPSLAKIYYSLTFLKHDIQFLSIHSVYEEVFHRLPPQMLGEHWVLENVSSGPRHVYDALKRLVDIIGALILGVIAFPICVCAALAMKLFDKGPLFYTAERVGQYNLPVRILKFRTMTGTDSSTDALQSTLTVTPLGAFMRRYRIDELPQLLNVLRGDLSFVGPRPEIPSLAHVYAEAIPYYNIRHLIKPGLSGWAQINNYDVPRGGVDVERTVQKLSFDLFYLKRRSLLLDIEIVLKTIATVISRSGT